MVGITYFFMVSSGCVLLFIGTLGPLILKLFVNNEIEKRYKCKLNLEVENRKFIPLYSYFKFVYPASTIALAYLLNSKKRISTHPGLRAINYNFKTAPKKEIIICVSFYLLIFFSIVCSVVFVIFTEIFDIKPF